jgi:hypothetical protein
MSSLLFKRVSFRLSWTDFGTGLVIEHHQATGEMRVVDEVDGTLWDGPEDHVEVLNDDDLTEET